MSRTIRLSGFNLVVVIAILQVMVLLGGCSGGGGASPASPVVTESFKTDANKNVAIKADALNCEFLLQGNMITLDGAQQFSGLKSRIVVFQKQAGKLFMLESQVGHTVTPDTPFALILAEFPIISEDSGWIYFDFNQGMSKIFMTSEMYASDSDGKEYQPSFTAATVRSSFLADVDASHLNRLAVRQSAQVEGANNTLPSVEVRYYLSPYLPDSTFTSTPSPGFDNAGYFEVMPQLESGGATKVMAMKWNLNNKPVTYYLSADTPQEYRQAIRDGVLYWNAALGREAFAVADAPTGITAPDMDRNIIQWLDYDTAGFAYADMQADPRTGEILNAQIFMPSAFAVYNRQKAWQFLKVMEQSSSTSSSSLIALKNLYSSRICNYTVKDRMMKGITALLANGATDAMLLRASQAYVQEVVTHEVGHTMGLRHNFAGTLAADLAGHTRNELYLNFLQGGAYIPMVPSSSVMDYHEDIEAILVANRFNAEQKALPHDISSMRFLYQGKELDKSIPYCTDTDVDAGLLDCLMFDYGNSPLEFVSSDLEQNLSVDVLPVTTYLNLAAKVMAGTSVANLYLSPASKAATLLQYKPLMLSAFTESGLYSRTLRQLYPGVLAKNADKAALRTAVIPVMRADLAAWLLKNSYGIKSVATMFKMIDPAWKDDWIARFNQITEDPAFYTIVDSDGKSRTFTPAERAQLRALAATYFTNLIPALAAQDIKLLSSATAKIDVVDGVAGDGLLAAMNAASSGYLMARTGASLSETVNGVPLSLPVFRYSWQLRQAAAHLLDNRTVPSALWWGVREAAANKSSLTALLNNAVLGTGDVFTSSSVYNGFIAASTSNTAFQWYLENTNILN